MTTQRRAEKASTAKKVTTPEYFDEFVAAEILGVSVHTLRNFRRRGCHDGPAYTRIGTAVRYNRIWLHEYAVSHIVEPTAA